MIDYQGQKWKVIWFYIKWNFKHNFFRLRLKPFTFIFKPLFPFIHVYRLLFQAEKYRTSWEIEISKRTGVKNDRILNMTRFKRVV